MQQVAGCSVFTVTSSDSSEEVFFPCHLCLHRSHSVAFIACSPCSSFGAAWMNWVTVLDWQLLCVVTPSILFPTRSLSPCLPHLCTLLFWLVLPWHRVARMRLHIQHLVFSSQRAADEIEARWRKNTQCTKAAVWRLRTQQLCQTLMGVTFYLATFSRLYHVGWPFCLVYRLLLTKSFFPFFFSSLLVLVFKRNHFFGNETGIFPHIMHINGYQWLTG